jgi:hypothetical protein
VNKLKKTVYFYTCANTRFEGIFLLGILANVLPLGILLLGEESAVQASFTRPQYLIKKREISPKRSPVNKKLTESGLPD